MFFICICERKHMSSPRSAPPPNTVPVPQPKHPHHAQPPCNPTPSSSSHPSFGLSTITGPTACAHPSQSRLEGWKQKQFRMNSTKECVSTSAKFSPYDFLAKTALRGKHLFSCSLSPFGNCTRSGARTTCPPLFSPTFITALVKQASSLLRAHCASQVSPPVAVCGSSAPLHHLQAPPTVLFNILYFICYQLHTRS